MSEHSEQLSKLAFENICQHLCEDRMTELEIKVAHQELLLDELNEVITKQQTEIDNFHHYLKLLQNKMQSLQFDHKETGDQAPPHY